MEWYEILLIVFSVLFVASVIVASIVRKKKGKHSCDCCDCSSCRLCSRCQETTKKDD